MYSIYHAPIFPIAPDPIILSIQLGYLVFKRTQRVFWLFGFLELLASSWSPSWIPTSFYLLGLASSWSSWISTLFWFLEFFGFLLSSWIPWGKIDSLLSRILPFLLDFLEFLDFFGFFVFLDSWFLFGPPGFFGFTISWILLDFPGFLQLFGLLVFFDSWPSSISWLLLCFILVYGTLYSLCFCIGFVQISAFTRISEALPWLWMK